MALKTPEQYEESLRKMNFKIYMMGELVKNPVDNPIIRPSINAIAMTYKLAHEAESADLAVTKSTINGEKVNRFNSIFTSPEDMVKKILYISDEIRVVGIFTLGYAYEKPAPRPRKNKEEIICYDKYE